MLLLLLLIIGLVALVVIIDGDATRLRPRESAKADPSYPFERVTALFTPAERSFMGVLEQAVGNRCRIMGKVRLGDIIKVRP
jgi:hypothetical protein